jgi:hypothetical protein
MPHIYRVEVRPRTGLGDGRSHMTAAHQLGITSLTYCQSHRLYFLQGDLSENDVQRLATACLADPVTEQLTINNWQLTIDNSSPFIEITFLPGVTDPPAENLRKSAVLLGIN